MTIHLKTEKEINQMRIGGKILAKTLTAVCNMAKPGVSTLELDQFAEKFIKENGGIPGFKGYHGFPGTLCTCRNEVIVHGIPKADDLLEEGDLLTVDCGVIYEGLYTDAARSITIGVASPEKEKLISTAYLALQNAINIAKPGNKLNEIGKAIQKTVEDANFRVIYDLTGHGIGKNLHEEPIVLNYYDKKDVHQLKPGMTIAIEPIFSVGTHDMITLKDNWTIVTKDDSCAVQVENTILITQSGNEILTKE